jgi:hypothetical protein
MRAFSPAWAALLAATACVTSAAVLPLSSPLAARQATSAGPVSWNGKAFSINGEEVLLYGAEFHPWRLPVPSLWRDPLSKLKASGVNTISIYTHWGLIMPSPDAASVSLEAPANRLADFLQIAKELGLFVIVRPGPYINAETNNGGMPGWVQNLETQLRVNTSAFADAWKPYVKAVVDASVPYQYKADGSGGTVLAYQVENEFQQTPSMEAYFDEIISFYHANNVTVPTTFNALSGTSDYVNSTTLDIWGKDSYPQSFDCARPDTWSRVDNYTSYSTLRPSNPPTIPEFQGGSYDAWGGSTYDNCALLTNSSFVRVFEKGALSDGIKLKSNYMGFGGTNWGNLAYGGLVYTSYDYGAGISEKRIKREKLGEIGLVGSFVQSFPAFAAASVVLQGTNLGVLEQDGDVAVSHLANGDAAWYFVRQADSSSSATTTFRISVDAAGQQLTLPTNGKATLNGRDAVMMPIHFKLPSGTVLTYSTADVSFAGAVDSRDVVFLHGEAGQNYEFALESGWTLSSSDDGVTIRDNVVNWTPIASGALTVTATRSGSSDILFRLGDSFYARSLTFPSEANITSLDGILGRTDRIVVQGAYHVANASTSSGVLALFGQLNGTSSTLEIVAPSAVTSVTFNGAQATSSRSTDYGSIVAAFDGASSEAEAYEAPALTQWKVADSLPEIAADYVPDDIWKSANLTSTPNAWFGEATTKNVLFAGAYGFHSQGAVLWQARFSRNDSGSAPTRLAVKYIGGKFFASSTWLNGQLVGATDVPTDTQVANATFDLPADALKDGENVFTVLIDSTGLEEIGSIESAEGYEYPRENTKQPRGILGFDLLAGNATVDASLAWSVTGNRGGVDFPDKTRGPLNEGGLYGERQGWHLPGFDDSQWASGAPNASDAVAGAGVKFFRTSFDLALPAGHDIPLSIVYGGNASDATQVWRSMLFVNGWQYGKRFVQFGPQVNFPIPPGILNLNGTNTLAVSLWSPDAKGASIPALSIEKQGVFAGAVPYDLNNPTYQEVRGA